MTSPARFRLAAVAALALVLVLGACAPTARSRPAVAVLNAPASERLAGSAETLESELQRSGTLTFDFLPDNVMRFQEGHNDFHGARSVASAARVARSFDAAVAVTVGANVLDRSVTVSKDGSTRQVNVTVQMEAIVIDPASESVTRNLYSQVFRGMRLESTADDIAPLPKDPTAQDLRDQALADLAPAVLQAVEAALSGSSGG